MIYLYLKGIEGIWGIYPKLRECDKMGKEIERKFLVKDDSYKRFSSFFYCKQGYICLDIERVVRARVIGEKGFLTIKGKTYGISRDEFEYEIPKDEASLMIDSFCLDNIVEKNRYKIEFENKVWWVDEFLGDNEGLVIAEIELESEEESFLKPSWIDDEITHDHRYAGTSLAKNAFKNW